jgi:hypothetical protein
LIGTYNKLEKKIKECKSAKEAFGKCAYSSGIHFSTSVF